MKAILNKSGINIFANFLPKLKSINEEPIFLIKPMGMLIYGMEKSKAIRYTFDLLPEAFADKLDITEEFKAKLNISQLDKMFKHSKKFDKVTLEFKGNVTVKLENQKGIKIVTAFPTFLIEEEDEFNFAKGFSEIVDHEEAFYFKIEAGAIKDIFNISKSFSSKQDESVIIEKAENSIRITAKHDATIATSALTDEKDSYLKDLDGVNGIVKIPIKPLETALSCCDLNSDVSIAIIDVTLLCVRQLTENYIFEAVIMGSKLEESE